MTDSLPETLFREAFDAAGEKHYGLAALCYPLLLGRDWRWALLGFAYIKCLDDVVDEDPRAERGLDVLKRQREFIETMYAGEPPVPARAVPERYGEWFFRWDRGRGGALRRPLEAVLETMAFDLGRRGKVFSRRELDDYLVKMGGALVDFLAHFASPRRALPSGYRQSASRAYLWADSLADLEHDLAFGVINIPSEDLQSYGIDPSGAPETRRAWLADRAVEVEREFATALALGRRLGPAMGVMHRLILPRKRRELRRFLAAEGLR